MSCFFYFVYIVCNDDNYISTGLQVWVQVCMWGSLGFSPTLPGLRQQTQGKKAQSSLFACHVNDYISEKGTSRYFRFKKK